MSEKGLKFNLIEVNPWTDTEPFKQIGVQPQTPVVIQGNTVATESHAICEYLDEIHSDKTLPLMGQSAKAKFEVRKTSMFFEKDFYYNAVKPIVTEKIEKYFLKIPPNASYIRKASSYLKHQISYIQNTLQHKHWLAVDTFSLADITAAAQISVLDYLNHIDWEKAPIMKEWYLIIKSRPSFGSILADHLKGFSPPNHYKAYDY